MNRIRIVTFFMVGVLLLVSCSPAASPTAKPVETQAPNRLKLRRLSKRPSPLRASRPNRQQRPWLRPPVSWKCRAEQTVIFENIDGRVAIPDNMNPYISGQYLDWGMWQANQESLFYLNYETGETVPWQASGFKYNDDFSGLTINIRDGVKWSDGEPFTAADVIFTINMLKDHPELQYASEMKQWVKDVQAPDPQTVVITLNSPIRASSSRSSPCVFGTQS